jgi:ATP-binding cassette subfamily B protein
MYLKDNPYIKLSRYSWTLFKEHRFQQIVIYSIFIVSIGISSLSPILYKWLINKIQTSRDVLHSVWIYALACIGLKLVEWLLFASIYKKQKSFSFVLSAAYLVRMHDKILRLSTEWHQENHSGAIINRLKKSYEALKCFLSDDFMFIRTFFRFIFALLALVYFSPLYGVLGLLLGFLTMYSISRLDKIYLSCLDDLNERDHVVSSLLTDNLMNYKTIVSLRLENKVTENLREKIATLKLPFLRAAKTDALKWAIVDTLITLIYVVIAIGYVYQHYIPNQLFLVGGLVAVLAYSVQFTGAFHDIAWLYALVSRIYADFKSFETVLSVKEVDINGSFSKRENNWNRIKIHQVNFVHKSKPTEPDTDEFQLSVDNFEIGRGQKIALIGESGCGKSTLLNLLRGLYKPTDSQVYLDGNASSWDEMEEQCALFPQEPEIFNDTLLYNLCLGLSFPDFQIKEACDMAMLSKVLAKMPNGLLTKINQKGTNLSGGERQLLAIARGILLANDSAILLLDEPTSSLDPVKERMIIRNLFRHFDNKTIISVLHNHSLLSYFDYVYIIEKGRVAWQGKFEEMELNGVINKHFNYTF